MFAINVARFGLAALLALPLIACGGENNEGPNGEQSDDALDFIPSIDFCSFAQAEAAAVVWGNDLRSELTSSGTNYVNTSCRRFVADFYVLPSTLGWNPWFIGIGTGPEGSWPTDPTSCTNLRQAVTIYRKIGGSGSFTKVTTYTDFGAWNGSSCELRRSGASIWYPVLNTQPGTGYDIYRIATSRTVNGIATPAVARLVPL